MATPPSNTMPLNIIFMGTPDFAVPALAALYEAGHRILCVYSQPPRPAGRGHKVQETPVHRWAAAYDIPVRTPKSLKKEPEQAEFAALKADLAVVAAYGLILPKAVLDAPRFGCLNIHASLLPRWRGASPIQRAIWAGDTESGVTIMQMDEGLDTGAMLLKGACPITPQTTAQSLHDALCAIGGDLIVKAAATLAKGESLSGTAQDDAHTCYAPLLTKEDGRIDWTQDAAVIDRQIRALNPWPGTYTLRGDGTRLKILAASLAATGDSTATTGVLSDKKGTVICGNGSTLRLHSIQPEGKKPMDVASAVNGGYVAVGNVV